MVDPEAVARIQAAEEASRAAERHLKTMQAALADLRALLAAAGAVLAPTPPGPFDEPSEASGAEAKAATPGDKQTGKRGRKQFDDMPAYMRMAELITAEPDLSPEKAAARIAPDFLFHNTEASVAKRLARGYRDFFEPLSPLRIGQAAANHLALKERMWAAHRNQRAAGLPDYIGAHVFLGIRADELRHVAAECLTLAPAMEALGDVVGQDLNAFWPPEPYPQKPAKPRRTKPRQGEK